jgi:hypothetical protein
VSPRAEGEGVLGSSRRETAVEGSKPRGRVAVHGIKPFCLQVINHSPSVRPLKCPSLLFRLVYISRNLIWNLKKSNTI